MTDTATTCIQNDNIIKQHLPTACQFGAMDVHWYNSAAADDTKTRFVSANKRLPLVIALRRDNYSWGTARYNEN